MCVKIFEGYSCGHCSIPVIHPCPQTWKSIHFPYCKFPAIRPIQLGHMCHGCNRIAWNHYWDQINGQAAVLGQAPDCGSYGRKDFLKDRRRNSSKRDLSNGVAFVQMNGTDSQMPREKSHEAQYPGYQIADPSLEAVNRSRENGGNGSMEGHVGMQWYLGPDRYQGESLNNMIVGASAVLAAGGTQNLRNYPTIQTPYRPEFLGPATNSHHQLHSLPVGQGREYDALRSTPCPQAEPLALNYTNGRDANIFADESRHTLPQYAQPDREDGNGTTLDARVPIFYPQEAIVGNLETPDQNPRVKLPVTSSKAILMPPEGPTLSKLSESLCQVAGGMGIRELNMEKDKIYEADLKRPINTAQLDVASIIFSGDMC